MLRIGMLVMKGVQWAAKPSEWLQWLPLLLALETEQRYRKSLRAIFVYWQKKYKKLNGDMATLEKTITEHMPKEVDWSDYFEAMKQLDFEEGEMKGKIDTAVSMLADGLPVEKVLLYTGLKHQDIAHLL